MDLLFQIFILIEHPVERDRLDTLQDLLLTQRENFLGLVRRQPNNPSVPMHILHSFFLQVYNLTSQIDRSSLTKDTANDLYSPETIKSMLLATNKFRPSWQRQESNTAGAINHNHAILLGN